MRSRRATPVVLMVLAALPAVAQERAAAPVPDAPERVRLAYLFSDGQTPVALAAYKALLAEHPELRSRVDLTFLTTSILRGPRARTCWSSTS